MNSSRPSVMCFSGLDATGGAGIQADIETLFSVGCHCTPVITALTVQNTQNASSIRATEATLLVEQARAVLEDIPVQCFKIGLLGNVESIEVIHTLLKDYDTIPVVLDPILVAGGGYTFSGEEVEDAIRHLLLPLTTVLTPNTEEIMKLAPSADNLDACANEILEQGCKHVLVTGTHAQSEQVENRFYSSHREATLFTWPRLPENYHGSGCTLAAALAGFLAHKVDVREAVQEAQRFTWESLSHGYRIGFGQHIPDRAYWNK